MKIKILFFSIVLSLGSLLCSSDTGSTSSATSTTSYCTGDPQTSQVEIKVGQSCAQNGMKTGNNFYKFTTGSSAATYTVSLSDAPNSGNINFAFYSDSSYNNQVGNSCATSSGTTRNCQTSASLTASTTYYFGIANNTGSNLSTPYINVSTP